MRGRVRQHRRRQIPHSQPHVLQRPKHIHHVEQARNVHDGRLVRLRLPNQLVDIRHGGPARLDEQREQALASAAQSARHIGRHHLPNASRAPPQRPIQVSLGRLRRLSEVLHQRAQNSRQQAQTRHHIVARAVLRPIPRNQPHRCPMRRGGLARAPQNRNASASRAFRQARSELQRVQLDRVRGHAHLLQHIQPELGQHRRLDGFHQASADCPRSAPKRLGEAAPQAELHLSGAQSPERQVQRGHYQEPD